MNNLNLFIYYFQELITRCLSINPADRPDAQTCLADGFFQMAGRKKTAERPAPPIFATPMNADAADADADPGKEPAEDDWA